MEFKNYTAQDSKGRVLAGATANIYQTGTQIVVSVFDENGNGVSQPLTADSFGQFSFAAANGSYDVAVTYGGSTSTIENERFFDPDDQASVAETLTNKTIDTANNTITVNLSDVSDWPASVSATEAGYLDGVTSGIQGQIDGKQDILSEGAFADGDKDKLDGIEASADVTDTANVAAAGALMDSEVTNLADVKSFDPADYATAAQGALADSAQQPPAEGAFADGDKDKLDGIEASADVTDTANVTAAGALMDSELTDIAAVKGLDQGVATTDTVEFARLGVGVSPVEELDVVGTIRATATSAFMSALEARSSADANSWARLNFSNQNTGSDALVYLNSSSEFVIRNNNAAETIFMTNGDNERMRIDSSGNVGIGTSSPQSELDVNGAITQRPLSADPADPDNGHSVQWVSDGTGSGDAGDVMMKINVGGTVKTTTLVDYSTL